MFTARMKYLVAVVLDRHVDDVTRELLSLGMLHFIKVKELQSGLENKVNNVTLTVSTTRLSEIRKRIETLLGIVNALPDQRKHVALEHLSPIDLDQTEKALLDITSRIQGYRDRQKALQQEILKLEDVKRQVALFGDLRSMVRSESQFSFLRFRAGTVRGDRFEDFKKAVEVFPAVVLSLSREGEQTSALVVTMRRDDPQTDRIMTEYDFMETEITEEMTGVKEEVSGSITRKIIALTTEQEMISAESRAAVMEKKDDLLTLWENLKLNELYYRIQSFFSRTARTVLFSGWVPAAQAKLIGQVIERATGGSCYVEWRDPERLEKEAKKRINVPVKLKNLKILSPFQMLVTNFSIPQYGTIDPTPIVAVLYLAMFGLMFGDVGQGLVIMAMGILGTLFGRFKKGMKEIVRLLIFCGGAAVVCGFLFGSFFGMADVVPALWFNFHHLVQPGPEGLAHTGSPVTSIVQVLLITLYFGIAIISLGLVLNWINLIRLKKWSLLIFDRMGLVGGWMYFGGIYVVYQFALSDFKAMPGGAVMLLALGIPALIFLGKPVFEFIEHKAEHPNKRFTVFTPIGFFFSWLLELLEFFTGYLSNSLSFMRVAGLGIAHVALMMAFAQIAEMLAKGGLPAVGVIVFIIGNIFVIALEGLSAGIQALRLNYYEFFSKYFRGSGEAYAPVSLGGQ